jgi:eukaryotic-like serine/threonine-protein kinase
VGPYILERRLGIGGMAEVFLAKKPLGTMAFKQVVVKRMRQELVEDERFVEMFLREAGILAQLNHPNIVQIFDLGVERDELYIALEYLDGISIHQLARRAAHAARPLPIELILRVVSEVARGLDYVHRMRGPDGAALGLVHRDVTPDNMFFVRDGTLKLLDFGIARGATMKLLTSQGELKGKVPYMAPEQLDGADLDGRADLFALGVTAYWLLTGRRPFWGATAVAVMRAIVGDNPSPPSALNDEVPRWLDAVIMSLLQKDRANRPASGADVDREIGERAAALLDRAADAAYAAELLSLPEVDLDDSSLPMRAVRRGGGREPRAEIPMAVSFEAPPDTLAADTAQVPRISVPPTVDLARGPASVSDASDLPVVFGEQIRTDSRSAETLAAGSYDSSIDASASDESDGEPLDAGFEDAGPTTQHRRASVIETEAGIGFELLEGEDAGAGFDDGPTELTPSMRLASEAPPIQSDAPVVRAPVAVALPEDGGDTVPLMKPPPLGRK